MALSLLAPGCGHLLLGKIGLALAIQAVWITILASGFSVTFATPSGFWLTAACAGAWALLAGAQAWSLTGRHTERLRWFPALIALLALNLMVEPGLVSRCWPWSRYQVGVFMAESMRPTLQPGDRVVIDLRSYRQRQVQRGELVAFESRGEGGGTWVMRCVAIPGDLVEVKEGACWVNGILKDQGRKGGLELGPRILASNELFLLGDNRANSYDSRSWGPLEAGSVRGRALYRVWPSLAL